MNFEYSEEQQMLEESLARLLAGREARQAPADGENIWPDYAELGLPAMNLDEADGGLGLGPVENRIVMREMGKGLCTSPFLASAIFGTQLLKAAASKEQKAAIAPRLVAGTALLAVAHAEPGSRYRTTHVETAATADGDGFMLTGRKVLVLGGFAATHLIVSARLSGEAGDRAGIALFIIPRSADGLALVHRRTIDGRTADDVTLAAVRAPAGSMLAEGEKALAALEMASDHATVASMNEAVGAMEALLAITVDYLNTRRQFGVTIGSFQALQHKAVDMFIEVEQAKSMALFATGQLDPVARDRRHAIALSKLHINRAARLVGEAAVQLHGAIGMTMESKAGRLFNRLTACQLTFGDSDFWLNSLLETTPEILAA
jgi:alkylation response protein AidB-like acyl-CoA dehydrogenase